MGSLGQPNFRTWLFQLVMISSTSVQPPKIVGPKNRSQLVTILENLCITTTRPIPVSATCVGHLLPTECFDQQHPKGGNFGIHHRYSTTTDITPIPGRNAINSLWKHHFYPPALTSFQAQTSCVVDGQFLFSSSSAFLIDPES